MIKSIALILCAVFMTSCGFKGCDEKCLDSFDPEFYYGGQFPILLHLTNDMQKEVIDIYNKTFGVEIFKSADSENDADFKIYDYMINFIGDEVETLTGETIYKFDYSTGKIKSGTIYINHEKIGDDDEFYKKVFAHELGHAIGAKHFCDCVMMPCATFSGSISDAIKKPAFSNWLFQIYGLEIAQGVSDE